MAVKFIRIIIVIIMTMIISSTTFAKNNEIDLNIELECNYSDFCVIPYSTINKVLRVDFDNITIGNNLKNTQFQTSKGVKINHYLADDGIRFIMPSETEYHISKDDRKYCDYANVCQKFQDRISKYVNVIVHDGVTFSATHNETKINLNIIFLLDYSKIYKTSSIFAGVIFVSDEAYNTVYMIPDEVEGINIPYEEDKEDIYNYLDGDTANAKANSYYEFVEFANMSRYGVVTDTNKQVEIKVNGNWDNITLTSYSSNQSTSYEQNANIKFTPGYSQGVVIAGGIRLDYPFKTIKTRSGRKYYEGGDVSLDIYLFQGNCELTGKVDMTNLDNTTSYINIRVSGYGYINVYVTQYQKISQDGTFHFKELPNIESSKINKYSIRIQDLKGNRSELIKQKLVCEPLATRKQGENDKK